MEIFIFFQISILLWFLYHTIKSGQTNWKRRWRPFRICVTHRGGELFFHRYRLSRLGDMDFQYYVIVGIFCSFFKFSLQVNPDVLKRIGHGNNLIIYMGYWFQGPKLLQWGELEKYTKNNFFFIFDMSVENVCKINFPL